MSSYALVNPSDEYWRPVHGYELKYDISSFGRVRSRARIAIGPNSRRRVSDRILSTNPTTSGYRIVCLWSDNKKRTTTVSRLVAMAFCIRPHGCDVVNHIDENKGNDHYLNLEWTTLAGNTRHSVAKLTMGLVNEIRSAPRGTGYEMAERMGVSIWTIRNIRRKKSDKWIAQ